jgi:hypothetical protein
MDGLLKLPIGEGNGMGDMAIYTKNLGIFFGLYIPSLTDQQKAIYFKICVQLK